MTQMDAVGIAHWRYPPPYAFYNAENDPADLAELLNCEALGDVNFAVVDDADSLVGFFSFERTADTLEVGLGLHPDLTGHGLGRTFVDAGLQFAQHHFAPARFRLAVATFNVRAIQVYRSAGFREGRTFLQHTNNDVVEFIEMSRPALPV